MTTYSDPVGPVQAATQAPNVRVTSQDATYTYVAWDAQPGAYGYRLFVDGVAKSVSFDPTLNKTRFKLTGHHVFDVLVLVAGVRGSASS